MSLGTVSIRQNCVRFLLDDLDRISVLFAARLYRSGNDSDEDFAQFDVVLPPGGCERPPSADLIVRLQKYVDDLCAEGCLSSGTTANLTAGEDSSYDSDCECDVTTTTSCCQHQDVSRTTSDTLAAEYADYVSSVTPAPPNDDPSYSPGYITRVEFALKLGYTEKLVRAALQKLGPAPTQNELLAELIKLGAQRGGIGLGGTVLSCDSSPTDIDVGSDGSCAVMGLGGGDLYALRPIVVDGSNVAMSHGNKEIFSCRGIKLCVDWFKSRGHRDITVFVPKWRKEAPRPDNPIRDQEILAELEKERMLVFTPSRLVGGKRMVCYDDRYILRLAAEVDGIVVSNDNYRDLCQESAEFRKVVEERILMYSFVNDRFMPPDDPLGRSGPTLDNFLRIQPKRTDPPPPCPYGKKCTYGNKCKYHHPERGSMPHKSVTERLSEHAQRHLQARGEAEIRKLPLGRTRSNVPPPKEPQHVTVSKSRSVDNVGTGLMQENLHRKLQRQLTLNPGADPRLLHRFAAPPPPTHQYLTNWEVHQHVTRIASAPDSYRGAWPNHPPPPHMQRMSSCSDTQLNVWPPQWHQQQAATSQLHEDARRKLHYHLAAIFPEEQVSHVMHMYPEETNPQKICAAILALYPKSQ